MLRTQSRSYTALITISAIVALTTSCATIATGRFQKVTFNSNPEGAEVFLAGRSIGTTPTTVKIARKKGQKLRFEKPGFKPLETDMATKINNWIWMNVVIGGLAGSTTDGLSGSMHEYAPGQYMISLEPLAAASKLEAETAKTNHQRTKDFIVTGYAGIQSDLNAGSGSYLDSLIRMLNIPSTEIPAAKKEIRALSDLHPDAPAFADGVLARYMK